MFLYVFQGTLVFSFSRQFWGERGGRLNTTFTASNLQFKMAALLERSCGCTRQKVYILCCNRDHTGATRSTGSNQIRCTSLYMPVLLWPNVVGGVWDADVVMISDWAWRNTDSGGYQERRRPLGSMCFRTRSRRHNVVGWPAAGEEDGVRDWVFGVVTTSCLEPFRGNRWSPWAHCPPYRRRDLLLIQAMATCSKNTF